MNKNQIIQVVNNLPKTQAERLLDSFKSNFEKLKVLEQKAKSIVVKDEEDTQSMVDARNCRLELKKIRVGADKIRKELKENALREANAIQGMFNILKATIVPLEQHLEDQEKFIERLEEKKKQELLEKRQQLLSQYVEDTSVYELKNMSEQGFEELLKKFKLVYEQKIQAELDAEKQRLEQERLQKLENERKIEISRYADFVDNFETIIFSSLSEKEYKILLENAKNKKEIKEKELEKQRKEDEKKRKDAEEKAKKEKEKREKLEAELKKKQDEERKQKELEKKRLEDEAKAKKEAELAPDKDKLIEFAKRLSDVVPPSVDSDDAKEKINEALNLINQAQLILNSL